MLVMFFCGGLIGRRGFIAESLSDFLPSVIGTYVVVGSLGLLAGLSFSEIAPMLGFTSVGVLASTVISFSYCDVFRQKFNLQMRAPHLLQSLLLTSLVFTTSAQAQPENSWNPAHSEKLQRVVDAAVQTTLKKFADKKLGRTNSP